MSDGVYSKLSLHPELKASWGDIICSFQYIINIRPRPSKTLYLSIIVSGGTSQLDVDTLVKIAVDTFESKFYKTHGMFYSDFTKRTVKTQSDFQYYWRKSNKINTGGVYTDGMYHKPSPGPEKSLKDMQKAIEQLHKYNVIIDEPKIDEAYKKYQMLKKNTKKE